LDEFSLFLQGKPDHTIVKGEFMKNTRMNHETAFTGLEAAIVLVAFIVVAAVFAYVVLGAGFFTTQKSQETVYKGIEQATSNIQMVGQVYGIGSGTNPTQINKIQFNLALAPGAPSLEMSKMIIVVSQPGHADVTQLTYSSTLTTATYTFTDPSANDAPLPTISGQKQGAVMIHLPTPLDKSGTINIEVRPPVGTPLSLTRTAPAVIESTQALH
jgi:archaeal flagellin FlaB